MAQIIDAMIHLAQEFKAAANKGEELGLKDDEYAFYEALTENESAVREMKDDQLLAIAREVANSVRNNASIDWRQREQVRAKLRVTIRRVLNRHKYPPENRDQAVILILEQAEALADDATS